MTLKACKTYKKYMFTQALINDDDEIINEFYDMKERRLQFKMHDLFK